MTPGTKIKLTRRFTLAAATLAALTGATIGTALQRNLGAFTVLLLLLCAAATAAVFYGYRLLLDLEAVAEAADKMAEGNSDGVACTAKTQEIGLLAERLNGMALLPKRYADLHKQLVSDISHELRTPITVLRAQIEALQDGVREPNAKSLALLHQGVMTLGKLVDDLHDLSKSDLGHLSLRCEQVNVGELLRETVIGFEARFQEKNISVDARYGENCVAHADNIRLRQLFSNLLENSLRYTNAEGKLVIAVESSDDHIALYFADSAPGVASEMLPRIFDRFFRTESSRNRVFGGSGLGLAICKSIAEGHGGTIRACQSSLGGLAVEVTLPRERSTANV